MLPTPGPAGNWAEGFVEAAAATLAAGRGALLLAPDARHLQLLADAATTRFGRGSFAVLAADAGPGRAVPQLPRRPPRQASGWCSARGQPCSPRSSDLGLVALWDDGNDAWSDPHAPYWHAREVAALRAHLAGCGLLLAAHARTAEVQQLVARAWLATIQLPPADARRLAAAVRSSAPDSERDPLAGVARLPHDTFTVVRAGLAAGPVLIQVPRAGYLPVLVCATCRTAARCPTCGQALTSTRQPGSELQLVRAAAATVALPRVRRPAPAHPGCRRCPHGGGVRQGLSRAPRCCRPAPTTRSRPSAPPLHSCWRRRGPRRRLPAATLRPSCSTRN